MKNVLLLIPLFLIALTANAATIAVDPGTNTLQAAVASASAGDVLELSTGEYTEDGGFYITKNLTIQAAENATPVIALQYSILIKNNAQVTFKGIKFDGGLYPDWEDSEHVIHHGAADHCLRPYNSEGDETLTLIGCEFTRFPSYVIYTQRDVRRMDAITIQNCYFYNNAKSAVYITNDKSDGAKQTCNLLVIENTTFVDITGSYDAVYFDAPEAQHDATLSVNHCTFYNHPKRAIYWQKSTNITVTNCIFAQPSTVSYKSVECAGGSITKCLSYNSSGYSSAAIPEGSGNIVGNPYFLNTNPASYDFSLWTTSPARNKGTDGKNLGDLRWNSDPSTHVATINITDEASNSLKAAVEAALPEDIIILANGTYEESESISIDKNLTIKAADGASPVVKPVGEFAISNAADVTIQNIKFDGSSQTASNFIYAADTKNNSLTIEGCEIYSFSNNAIATGASQHFSACTIDDCYFHDCTKSAIYFPKTSKDYNACDALHISNSTFADFAGTYPVVTFYNRNETTNTPAADDAELRVDHCTFYNFEKSGSNSHSFVDCRKSANSAISNCIFVQPSAQTYNSTYCYGGTVSNCLSYNTGGHRTDGVTISGCFTADPLFTDAPNGDFTFAGNWVTMSLSPARGAATDGTDLGDPRWYSDEVVPTTNLASAYALTADKAQLAGNIVFETGAPEPQTPYIRYNKSTTAGTAKWKINITRPCYISATINMADNEWNKASDSKFENHKHIFGVELFDENNHSIGSVVEGVWTEDGYEGYPTINLPGTILIEQAGVYTVVLTNTRTNTRCGVDDVTIAYAGGDVQTITNTEDFVTNLNDAWLSAGASRADGKISFPAATMSSAWARWNIHVANADYYDMIVNFDKGSADHNVGLKIYNSSTTILDKHAVAVGSQTSAASPKTLGRVYLPIGDYVMEYTNTVNYSTAKLISVEAKAFVAPTISLPGTLPVASAMTSELAYPDDGQLYFVPEGKEGYIQNQWAQWKVSVASAGSTYLFTMNVTSTNVQKYKISILDSETNEIAVSYQEPSSGAQTLKHYFYFTTAGNYFVKVQNTNQHSDGHMVSLVVSNPPEDVITLDESATSIAGWEDKVVDDQDATEPKYTVQIIRTLKAGMYNTLCLPFGTSSAQAKDIFGQDAKIFTLDEAIVEEGGFVLNLTLDDASDTYQGTPVFIKPARDIVNPVFDGVVFKRATPATSTGTHANFTGTFIKTTLTAGSDVLFLAANDLLYYPTADIDVLGMRGWLVIHDVPTPSSAISRARIVEHGQVATEIELVGNTLPTEFSDSPVRKLIQNGQLIILRDGVEYNVMGVRVK